MIKNILKILKIIIFLPYQFYLSQFALDWDKEIDKEFVDYISKNSKTDRVKKEA